MNIFYLILLCILGFSMFIGISRMLIGPTILDRILGFDVVAISGVAILVTFGIFWDTLIMLDFILVFSVSGFLSTFLFVFYLYNIKKDSLESA